MNIYLVFIKIKPSLRVFKDLLKKIFAFLNQLLNFNYVAIKPFVSIFIKYIYKFKMILYKHA